jgi:hypothetical protein
MDQIDTLLHSGDRMVQMKECHCPGCGVEIDTASSPMDLFARPSPGDLSICSRCTSILVFTSDLSLAVLTDEAFDTLAEEDRFNLRKIRRVIREIKKEHERADK